MSPHRLLAILVVLALAVAVSVGGAVANAERVSSGRSPAPAAKRAKAARCAKQRRARRRGATPRKQLRGCGAGRVMHLAGKKTAAGVSWVASSGGSAATAWPAPTPTAPAPADRPTSPPVAETPPPAPVVSTLGVTAYDMNGFVLRLTKTSVPAGTLTIFFRNGDVSDHNLWISSADGDTVERISDTVGLDGGASRTLPVTAGAWRLFCALPDHDAMTRTLTVTG